MEFTYNAYKDLISLLRNNNYSFASYHNYSNFDKCVIMRHDIDYSLDKAVYLARIEQDVGIRSTYFVLISSPFYNIVSNEAKRKIDIILNAGHEIGLHFDELNYTEQYYQDIGGMENAIFQEIELTEKILGEKIKSVLMHRPSKQTLQADYNLGDIKNSYGKEFFDEFKYVSDSRRRWRENVEKIVISGDYNRLHILTHAFWYNIEEKDIKQTISAFIDCAGNERYYDLNCNITDLADIMGQQRV